MMTANSIQQWILAFFWTHVCDAELEFLGSRWFKLNGWFFYYRHYSTLHKVASHLKVVYVNIAH